MTRLLASPRHDVDYLLSAFPKQRPPLSAAHERVYVSEYRRNRQGKGGVEALARSMDGWLHRRVAARCDGGQTLEIGAGTLNHMPYEPIISAYDVVEPFTTLYGDSPWKDNVRTFYKDMGEVPPANRYRRVISIGVLEHLVNLPQVLALSGARLADGGLFQAGIPAEGGILWGLSWRMTTGLSYRLRTGLDYGVLMRHEHVNRASEIIALVRHFFAEATVRWFPLPNLHMSLYAYIEASRPRLDACKHYL